MHSNKYATGIASEDSMLKSFFEDELKDIYWAEKHSLIIILSSA